MFNKKLEEKIEDFRAALSLKDDLVRSLQDECEGLTDERRVLQKKNAQLVTEKRKLQAKIEVQESRPDLPWANHEMGAEERTARAKELLSNPLMREIFDGIEDGLIKKLSEADLSNHVELIAYTQGLQIREQMIKYIEDRVNDQKVVEFNLQQAAKARL